jgi:hypothetical protein
LVPKTHPISAQPRDSAETYRELVQVSGSGEFLSNTDHFPSEKINVVLPAAMICNGGVLALPAPDADLETISSFQRLL